MQKVEPKDGAGRTAPRSLRRTGAFGQRGPRLLALAALALAAIVGVTLSSGGGRAIIKRSPVLRRLNAPITRQADSWWYNLRYQSLSREALGDGRPPGNILFGNPAGLARSESGEIYVSDRGLAGKGHVVWEIGERGALIRAGTGRRGVPRSGAQARETSLGSPQGIALDGQGRLYVADSYNHSILRLDPDGRLVRIAGTGRPGSAGDGGPAVEAELDQPYDVRIDARGELYIADYGNHRIRKVTAAGIMVTVAGTGEPGYGGDGGPGASARLQGPYGVFPDHGRGVLIADSENHVIRLLQKDGTIRTLAGTGTRGDAGDDGPADQASFDTPQSLWVDEVGRIYVGDEHNHRIRVIDRDNIVRRLAGDGRAGFSPDGTPALDGRLSDPEQILALPGGDVLFTEAGSRRLRSIDSAGRLQTIAGSGR